MKFAYKISSIILLGAALAIGGVAHFGYSGEVNSLEKSIATNNQILAQKTMNAVDRKIQRRIEQIKIYGEYLSEKTELPDSNRAYAQKSNLDDYIAQMDSEWVANFDNENYQFANEILNNDLSTEIKDEFQASGYYQSQYGYLLFPEIILTNKYGTNVALTNKTSDFMQGDEEWWQNAKTNGMDISNIEYDPSSKTYSMSVAVSILDKDKNFMGVFRAFINPEDAFEVVQNDYKEDADLHTAANNYINYEIIDRDGKTIFSVQKNDVREKSVSDTLLAKIKNRVSGNMIVSGNDTFNPGVPEMLVSFCLSSGSRDYPGLGWSLIIEHDTAEIFASAQKSAINLILILIPIILVSVLLVIIVINRILLKSLSQITDSTKKIAEGNLDERVDIKSRDEIGDLAQNFNAMVAAVKESRASIDRKVAEQTEEINEAKVKDEAYLESIGDGVIAVDKDQKIILVNRQAETILGFSHSELIDKKFSEVIKLVDDKNQNIEVEKRPIQQVLLSGKKNTFLEYSYVRKDKSKIPVALTTAPIILAGEVIGAIDVFRDITQEKLIDKAKTEFVSLASHQLRTPLSAVNWYAEMLLAGDVGKLNGEQKKYVEEIYAGNQRMVDLVNALLDVSRIELGTFAINPTKTDLVEIAKSLIKELTPAIKEKKQKVIEKYDGDLPKIMADPKLIRIVIQNLLSNAVKYTPEKGTVTISIIKIDQDIEIQIKDTGYGIPKGQQSQIFQKLFRADNVRTKDTEGTGLGLYIVKSIVTQSGGKIWFDSIENKGTTFYVKIPLKGMEKKEGIKALEDIK